MRLRLIMLPVLLAMGLSLGSCKTLQSALNATKSKLSFGQSRREVLVDRVEDAQLAQVDAKSQFEVTYDLFKQLTEYKGGELEDLYNGFRNQIELCSEHRTDLLERIEGIEAVSTDLFTGWGTELQEIQSPNLRDKSQARLEETVTRYERLVGSLKATYDKMEPVIGAFQDHVLYLKHDLNAHAIASLDESVKQVEADISDLFAEMQSSLKQADAFVSAMSTHQTKSGN